MFFLMQNRECIFLVLYINVANKGTTCAWPSILRFEMLHTANALYTLDREWIFLHISEALIDEYYNGFIVLNHLNVNE